MADFVLSLGLVSAVLSYLQVWFLVGPQSESETHIRR